MPYPWAFRLPLCIFRMRVKKKNQVARCERGVDAPRCASVCVSLRCVSVRLPVERRGNEQRRGQGTLTPAILIGCQEIDMSQQPRVQLRLPLKGITAHGLGAQWTGLSPKRQVGPSAASCWYLLFAGLLRRRSYHHLRAPRRSRFC